MLIPGVPAGFFTLPMATGESSYPFQPLPQDSFGDWWGLLLLLPGAPIILLKSAAYVWLLWKRPEKKRRMAFFVEAMLLNALTAFMSIAILWNGSPWVVVLGFILLSTFETVLLAWMAAGFKGAPRLFMAHTRRAFPRVAILNFFAFVVMSHFVRVAVPQTVEMLEEMF